jgi:hypothetical protein
MVRPFTLGRLADVIRLSRAYRGITSEHVEEAMIVTKDRAIELLKQAEDMKLIKLDGLLFHPTILGNAFFEALRNDDRTKLDNIFGEYQPYRAMKNIISVRSASIAELKQTMGLTEVGVEIILRLVQYVSDDLCCVNERFYLRTKELPKLSSFSSSVQKVYSECCSYTQWGCSRDFVRLDKIAGCVCAELRLSLDDFSKLLEEASECGAWLEIHSEVAGYEFMPFSSRKLNPASYRKCYVRLGSDVR